MSKVQASVDLATVKEEEFQKYVTLALQDIVRQVNGGLDFQSNFAGQLLSVIFTAANTNTSLGHSLGRVPAGYIITSLSASMVVYTGSAAWTSSTINLKSSATGTAGVLVY